MGRRAACRSALAIALAVTAAGCTHANAPKARLAGEILSLTGVAGLIVGALTTSATDHTAEVMTGFSIVSGLGIGLYAVGELTDPQFGPAPETLTHRHRRWAKILTERAAGAAREGNCKRVRRLERRVHVYNRELHDFVFMRDPEILRCLEAVPPASVEDEAPTLPSGIEPGIPPGVPGGDASGGGVGPRGDGGGGSGGDAPGGDAPGGDAPGGGTGPGGDAPEPPARPSTP